MEKVFDIVFFSNAFFLSVHEYISADIYFFIPFGWSYVL